MKEDEDEEKDGGNEEQPNSPLLTSHRRSTSSLDKENLDTVNLDTVSLDGDGDLTPVKPVPLQGMAAAFCQKGGMLTRSS